MTVAGKKIDIKNKWFSCYIFHDLTFEKLISELVIPLVDELKAKKVIDKYFFIRYWENGQHLRLRGFLKQVQNTQQVEELINRRSNDYFQSQKKQVVYSIVFNNYVREIERYGGIHAMEIAESHFNDSSDLVAYHIAKYQKEWTYPVAIGIALQMQLIFAREIFLSPETATHFFFAYFQNWLGYSVVRDEQGEAIEGEIAKSLSYFKNSFLYQKHKLVELTNSTWYSPCQSDWEKKWRKVSRSLRNQLNKLYQKQELTSPSFISNDQYMWPIYESHIHMTNNRLGIHLRDEAFIAYLILNALKSVCK